MDGVIPVRYETQVALEALGVDVLDAACAGGLLRGGDPGGGGVGTDGTALTPIRAGGGADRRGGGG
ncbi:hypothetical protein GCM10020000_52560 [Streptomyces olivoverticillatus]